MSSFDRLHLALQHHIVNSLGWRDLRPLQELSIDPILGGCHCLLLAPTAGGKTESAVFPVLSRMLSEAWTGLSVLYICPLKALLNNLQVRLEQYTALVGRSCGLWHGDVEQARRQRVLRHQPDILLTTPESIEAMLVSRRVAHRELFQGLRAIIVDEIHAFAGDDRGWHLLAVLERVTRLAAVEPQRIGLSATVGNPDELLDWLAAHRPGERRVVSAPAKDVAPPDVEVDFVGNLDNAATVISRLHRGEKRLVFCDSRSRVEQLGGLLRRLGIETFLSHSSLSVQERREAEAKFSAARDCVIVATSTLELGIDVGDLDRVIQIDAPTTVASLLQRLGRTGRRAGTRRNCLFLATTPSALHQTLGLVELWRSGYIEPIQPPPLPLHVFSQQLLALILQEGGIGRASWGDWLLRLPVFADIPADDRDAIVNHLLDRGILQEDNGVLYIGREGEAEFGYRYFSELLSVFTSSPMVTVLHGQRELGTVDQANFFDRTAPRSISLGGRSWRLVHLDWRSRRAWVESDETEGRTRWFGGSTGLGSALADRMKDVLLLEQAPDYLSRRATTAFAELKAEFEWLRPDGTVLREDTGKGRTVWWTFAGSRVNHALATLLRRSSGLTAQPDSLAIRFHAPATDVLHQLTQLFTTNADYLQVPAEPDSSADATLKFSDLLPDYLRTKLLTGRAADPETLFATLALGCKSPMEFEHSRPTTRVSEG